LVQTKRRDEIKAQKCAANHVTLVCWTHTEPLNPDILIAKLAAVGIPISP
jgi:hypothetical protein